MQPIALWWGPQVQTDKPAESPTDIPGQQSLATVTGPMLDPCSRKPDPCAGVWADPNNPTRAIKTPQPPLTQD